VSKADVMETCWEDEVKSCPESMLIQLLS
jgi:hypothetical protein